VASDSSLGGLRAECRNTSLVQATYPDKSCISRQTRLWRIANSGYTRLAVAANKQNCNDVRDKAVRSRQQGPKAAASPGNHQLLTFALFQPKVLLQFVPIPQLKDGCSYQLHSPAVGSVPDHARTKRFCTRCLCVHCSCGLSNSRLLKLLCVSSTYSRAPTRHL
jgi:hypothetical protein